MTSKLAEMGPDTKFRRIIPEIDRLGLDKKVRRIVLCSGKVYYDLLAARREAAIKDVAIVRVEQLYPWPRVSVSQQISRYPNAEVVWCQEEPANMGAWTFVEPRLAYILEGLGHKNAAYPLYVGRTASASPATGTGKVHVEEQARLVEEALNVDAAALSQPFRPVRA